MKSTEQFFNADEIQKLLEAKYAPPTYAYFPEVKASVGFSNRTADGIAIAMWRSHDLAVHGFEIKTYRGDWLRELKQPDKSDEVSGYCDYWWVVALNGIVKAGELPENWGLMIPTTKGLFLSVKAPKLKPDPLSREFVCEIMRNFHRRKVRVNGLSEDYRQGLQEGVDRERALHKEREERVSEFEKYSGIDLMKAWPERLAKIGIAVKALIEGDAESAKRELEWMLTQARDVVKKLEDALGPRKSV